jgi:hypothetical protein
LLRAQALELASVNDQFSRVVLIDTTKAQVDRGNCKTPNRSVRVKMHGPEQDQILKARVAGALKQEDRSKFSLVQA